MAEKALFTVGVFAGIINSSDGRLLLRRRTEEGSILPGQSFRGNWELPGGGVTEGEKIPYNHLIRELERELVEEIGASPPMEPGPMFFTASFKNPKTGAYDLALVTPILVPEPRDLTGDTLWVSPGELNQLAKEFVASDKKTGADGKGLLSGWGKRMHCMALAALCYSPNQGYAKQARDMLAEISATW